MARSRSPSRLELAKREAFGIALFLTIAVVAISDTLGAEILPEVAAISGFLLVLPLIAILGERLPLVGSDDGASASATATEIAADDEDDPVAKLRDRYARGELTDDEFERKLDRLLETEDLDVESGRSRDHVTELE
ncbi:SHOCT domain-containing protein [Halosimplex sp. TS25]|uniref:SHOCT domain-containing protein n=1 Tax=Halosimplex rarum TaxID=3396619 RepID=UPI0039ED986F